MSAVINEDQPVMAPHWKLSTGEYHRMIAAGILQEDDRVELIAGELIDMAPIGPVHASLSSLLFRKLGYATEGRAIPWSQNPIFLEPQSEPQPDFALLTYQANEYRGWLPKAQDVLLVVEIADATLRYDREIKAPLYARSGLPEYWIINIAERKIEVHLNPDPATGRYQDIREVTHGVLAPTAFPDVEISLIELLG
jgi:Uma2 family endonuclease